eukprot:2220028-Rhodomonas_salina.1
MTTLSKTVATLRQPTLLSGPGICAMLGIPTDLRTCDEALGPSKPITRGADPKGNQGCVRGRKCAEICTTVT